MFPPNLYENGGYFTYKNTITGETFSFGRDRARAFAWAIECNVKIRAKLGIPDMVARVMIGVKIHTETPEMDEVVRKGLREKAGMGK